MVLGNPLSPPLFVNIDFAYNNRFLRFRVGTGKVPLFPLIADVVTDILSRHLQAAFIVMHELPRGSVGIYTN